MYCHKILFSDTAHHYCCMSCMYSLLPFQDMIKFGFSSREYILLHENSQDMDAVSWAFMYNTFWEYHYFLVCGLWVHSLKYCYHLLSVWWHFCCCCLFADVEQHPVLWYGLFSLSFITKWLNCDVSRQQTPQGLGALLYYMVSVTNLICEHAAGNRYKYI